MHVKVISPFFLLQATSGCRISSRIVVTHRRELRRCFPPILSRFQHRKRTPRRRIHRRNTMQVCHVANPRILHRYIYIVLLLTLPISRDPSTRDETQSCADLLRLARHPKKNDEMNQRVIRRRRLMIGSEISPWPCLKICGGRPCRIKTGDDINGQCSLRRIPQGDTHFSQSLRLLQNL